MTAASFAAGREASWQRLATLVDGPARRVVPPSEAAEVARLYRRVLVELGRLRTLTAAASASGSEESPTVAWLNEVVARAHGRIYLSAPVRRNMIASFFKVEFPRRFRAALPRITLSAAVFGVAALIAYLLSAGNPAIARTLAGPMYTKNAEAFAQVGSGRMVSESAVMSSFYVRNNVQAAFTSFALGLTAGIGTLATIVMNGMVMGVTIALVTHFGFPARLFAYVAAHGPVELLAFVVAAAAGLGLGDSLLRPGPWRRLVALRRAAADSIYLVAGASALLVVAAFFEAFVSPSTLEPSLKYGIGAVNALLLAIYFTRAGRRA